MPSVLKFHVSSGLQVLDLPFVRDHSLLSLNPGPLCLVHSIYSSSLAILAPTRTHEPSIWPPFYFCSPSHRLSLPVQWPVITVTSLGAPLLILLHVILFLLYHSPGQLQLPSLGLTHSLLADFPGSGPFLLQRSY